MSTASRVLAVVGVLLVLFMLSRALLEGVEFDNDASAYIAAAERVMSGAGIYALDSREGVHEYAYPPTLAILLIPAALFGTLVAFVLWCGFSVACWVLAVVLIVKSMQITDPTWRWTLAVIPSLLVLRLLDSNFGNGQANSMILLVFAATCFGFGTRRQVLAGAAIGLGAALKIAPIGFVAHFIANRNWRALGTTVTVVALLAIVLPMAVMGAGVTSDAYRHLFGELMPVYSGIGKHDLSVDGGYVAGQSLRPMTFRYLTESAAGKRRGGDVKVNLFEMDSSSAEVAYLTTAMLVAIAGLFMWRAGRTLPHPLLFDVSVAVLVLLLASPYARKAYFLLLLLPYTYLLNSLHGMTRRVVVRGVVAALALHGALVLAVVIFGASPPHGPLAAIAVAFIWMLRVRGQERVCFAIAYSWSLTMLSAPGILGSHLANRMLALSCVGVSALFLFALFALIAASRHHDERSTP